MVVIMPDNNTDRYLYNGTSNIDLSSVTYNHMGTLRLAPV